MIKKAILSLITGLCLDNCAESIFHFKNKSDDILWLNSKLSTNYLDNWSIAEICFQAQKLNSGFWI